ncbi:hypothetical protein AZE42_04904 [Rhizopogon vesiculosus]|uniref:Uncharacterized protein n=1 Tax=Rhizopogon vesiculosus TaxID=180088 RepID=A0A1J8QKS0_9AGAM|nr:hypothetical protein AZE42_04904 [Rhizopogon vesiculosus]
MCSEEYGYNDSSIEMNQQDTEVHAITDQQCDFASIDLVQRRLNQRHLQMYVHTRLLSLEHSVQGFS